MGLPFSVLTEFFRILFGSPFLLGRPHAMLEGRILRGLLLTTLTGLKSGRFYVQVQTGC